METGLGAMKELEKVPFLVGTSGPPGWAAGWTAGWAAGWAAGSVPPLPVVAVRATDST